MNIDQLQQYIKLANCRNKTPFYIFDVDSILQKYETFQQTWEQYFPNVTVAYSYKTNALRGITQRFRRLGAMAEVVSGTELNWALHDGFSAERILFDGPVKTDEELKTALTLGVKIQVDSLDELKSIIAIANQNKIKPILSLRLSTYYSGQGLSRFGLTYDEYMAAVEVAKQNKISLKGLHFHIGSNINNVQKYLNAIDLFSNIIQYHLKTFGNDMWLDIGGGFPAQSVSPDKKLISMDQFAKQIRAHLDKLNYPVNQNHIIVEPGRCLVEDHGYLVTRVTTQKKRQNKKLLIVDGGINLVSSLKSWHHPMGFVQMHKKGSALKSNYTYTVYGSNCFESDKFIEDIQPSQEIGLGDYFIVGSAGGYDIPSANVWTRPAPPIYGVFNQTVFQLRQAQQNSSIRADHITLEDY